MVNAAGSRTSSTEIGAPASIAGTVVWVAPPDDLDATSVAALAITSFELRSVVEPVAVDAGVFESRNFIPSSEDSAKLRGFPSARGTNLSVRRETIYDQPIPSPPPHIGTLNEGSLHAALKAYYAEPGDELEVPLDGFVIDIRRPDLLVEIQTSSFGSMGNKFDRLLGEHRMLLVHPIAVETYLQRPGRKPRKSPKRGSVFGIFEELVSIPTLLDHPNLMLDVVLVSVTDVQQVAPRARRGRGGYRTIDRQLRQVLEVRRFGGTDDLAALLPAALPPEFTTADIAAGARVARDVAQRMAFCFRALDVITEVGRTRAGLHYARTRQDSR